MTSTTPAEQAAIEAASAARDMCACQENDPGGPCDGSVPLPRSQAVRLRAYAAQHPERAIIYTELEGLWMAALHVSLPAWHRIRWSSGCAIRGTCLPRLTCGIRRTWGNCWTASELPPPLRPCPEPPSARCR